MSIDNLVPDIYALLEKDVPLSEGQVQDLTSKLHETLLRELASAPQKRASVSMSNLGEKCLRKLWYREHMPQLAEKMKPWERIKLLYGHILEDLLLCLVKCTGKHTVTGEQTTLDVEGIKGHRDAVIDGMVIDVKSANSRSFEKFKNHELEFNDPFNYVTQLSAYVEGSKKDDLVTEKETAGFLAVDKELGHVVLDTYRVQPIDFPARVEQVKRAVECNEPPTRYYSSVADGKSGNEVICTQCRYCPYKKECWKDSNNGRGLRTFIYSNGPRWLTKVVRTPDVQEL
jgi:hypothetical protein